jgi:Zn-dependent peptidase ImmA (M78 family)/transcriptional regulator
MAMISAINPYMITLARETRGLTQQDLADKLKLHKANVSRLEKRNTNIHDETLLAISEATCYPPKFFVQEGYSVPVNLAYRKRQQVPVKLLTPIEAKMNIIRRHAQFITKALDKPVPKLPVLEVTDDQSPIAIAKAVKIKWNIKDGTIDNVTKILEEQGVIISAFDFDTERVDSRTMLTDDKYPIIFLNKNLLGDKLRYSLAYELAHLVMHTFTNVQIDRDISREANQFAAEFLIPGTEIIKDFRGGISLSLLGELKRKWKVSMISLLYRADDLGLLTSNQKRYLLQQFNHQKIRRREPIELDVTREKPLLLKKLIQNYITEYEIDRKKMADIFAIPLSDYVEYYG